MAVALDPGTIFAGDFRIVQPLGQGGMGAVYKVEQISTGKPRALKLMHPQLVADANLRRRFEQEARIGAHIDSEHVVEVQVAGVDQQTGLPYLVMEFLAGQDLAEYVQKRGALPAHEVHAIFEQLCHAMIAAHRAGIVHRDIKPENVFLAQAKRANATFMIKVLDFGIAKLAAEAGGSSSTAAMGSPLWMSPEQTERRPITPAADVWALGLMAFNLLTGIHVWRATDATEPTMTQLLRDILIEPIPLASARAAQRGVAHLIPDGFDAFLARCLAREPTHRFQDAAQFWAALEPMLRAPRSMQNPPPPTAYSPYAPQGMPAPYSGQPVPPTAPMTPMMAPMMAPMPPPGPYGGYPQGTPPPFTQSGPTPRRSSSKLWVIPVVLLLPIVGGTAFAGWYVATHNKGDDDDVPPIPSVTITTDAGSITIGSPPPTPTDNVETPGDRTSLAWMWNDSGTTTNIAPPTPTGTGKTGGTFAAHKADCDTGDEFQCVNVGFDYQQGVNGAPQDYSRAATFYKKACDENTKNGAEGCADLGWLYEMAKGVPKDLSKAATLYQQGCDLGAKLGCNNMGVMLRDGNGVAKDNGRAVTLFDKACNMNDAQACANLGYMYSKGLGVPADPAKAIALYQQACDKNDPYGCHNLGYRYQMGDGVAKDTAKAATLYRKGCDNGQMDSCVNLGTLYEAGDGVALDQPKAVGLYQKACDRGQGHGCQYAGSMYRDGKGIAQDLAKAKADYKKGCAVGDAVSCTESGKLP